MTDLQLLIDLHIDGERQGPGSSDATRRAIDLAGLAARRNLNIADIGCGTGAASLILAQDLDAQITAVDALPDFLRELERRSDTAGLQQRITTCHASMDALPFEHHSLDVIWSEGAIYNIGFETGLKLWRPLLKPGGILAVSELTWLTVNRPEPLSTHWHRQYPEVALASEKIAQIEANGYSLLGYFPLPQDCWLENYYHPMQRRFDHFLRSHGQSEQAQELVRAEREEILLYEDNKDYVSYGFYVAEKLPD